MNALLVFAWSLVFGSIGMMFRTIRVAEYRRNLLNQLSDAGHDDIKNRRPWYWRFNAFEQVSFDEMVFKFWKPIRSFYADLSFTEIKKSPVRDSHGRFTKAK